jgi:preprotein translocase subunit YajC
MSKINFLLFSVLLFAQNIYADGAAAPSVAQTGSAFGSLMPLLIIFIFFYLFLIRPQQKQRKELEKQINSIKKDDTILTSGGIYARVIAVKEQDVEAEISHNVRVKIAKSAIVSVLDNNKPVTPEVIKK